MIITEKMLEVFEEHRKMRNKLVFAMNASMPSPDMFKDNSFTKLKLNNLQTNILLHLRDNGIMTVGEIAKREGTHKPAISKPVVYLAKIGLIHRFHKDDDLRCVYAQLTEYARELLNQQSEVQMQYEIQHYYSLITMEKLKEMSDKFSEYADFFSRVKESQENEVKPKLKSGKRLILTQ